MENMKNNQTKLRPEIQSLKITESMSEEEKFQNKVLRPVIKMKHEILIAHFKNYVALSKRPWKELSDSRKINFIENIFSRDLSFRNEVRGLVIGQFTLEEYSQYAKILRGSNKRMNNIIKERIMSHLDILSQ